MLEAQIPKDVRKYEAKLVGPFTLRQLICFIIACILAYFAYKGISAVFSVDFAIPVCMLLISPIIAIGWVKPYGMPLEKFLQSAFIGMVLAPKVRKYKTKNNYSLAAEPLKKLSDKEYKERIKKEKKMAQSNLDYMAYK